jgi:hypothetical protein|tara:strand:- start:2670 stop:2897 length:228 start_codon:yes stop_codon:yes gene_type:complete
MDRFGEEECSVTIHWVIDLEKEDNQIPNTIETYYFNEPGERNIFMRGVRETSRRLEYGLVKATYTSTYRIRKIGD